MNKLEKYKAEIERKIGELKQFKKASYEIGLYDGYMFALSFIDSLSDTEKDFGIKESVIPFGASDSELMEATYFIPQGYHAVIESNKVIIKKGEEPVSNDLEEFAKRESELFGEREYEIDFIDRNALAKGYYWGVKAGAQWQKEQDQSTIELAEDHAMLAGMEKMKQEMMGDAVDAEVITGTVIVERETMKTFLKYHGLKTGDKVKLIIIREE